MYLCIILFNRHHRSYYHLPSYDFTALGSEWIAAYEPVPGEWPTHSPTLSSAPSSWSDGGWKSKSSKSAGGSKSSKSYGSKSSGGGGKAGKSCSYIGGLCGASWGKSSKGGGGSKSGGSKSGKSWSGSDWWSAAPTVSNAPSSADEWSSTKWWSSKSWGSKGSKGSRCDSGTWWSSKGSKSGGSKSGKSSGWYGSWSSNPTICDTPSPAPSEPCFDVCGKTEDLGTGCCKDEMGEEYPGFMNDGFYSADECAVACEEEITSCGLVGFEFKGVVTNDTLVDYWCFCQYDVDKISEITPPDGWDVIVEDMNNFTLTGNGTIADAGNCTVRPEDPQPTCYRYTVSTLQSSCILLLTLIVSSISHIIDLSDGNIFLG